MRSLLSFLIQVLAGAVLGFLVSFLLPGTGHGLLISYQPSQTTAAMIPLTAMQKAAACAQIGAIFGGFSFLIPRLRLLRR